MSAPNEFAARHVGPRGEDVASMLEVLGYHSLDSFIDAVVPESVRMRRPLALPPGRGENAVIATRTRGFRHGSRHHPIGLRNFGAITSSPRRPATSP